MRVDVASMADGILWANTVRQYVGLARNPPKDRSRSEVEVNADRERANGRCLLGCQRNASLEDSTQTEALAQAVSLNERWRGSVRWCGEDGQARIGVEVESG